VGNDSRCGGSDEWRCGKLAGEGADCKWRATFSVTGSMRMAVSNAQNFVDNPGAKSSIQAGIADVSNVPAEYVDVDLAVQGNTRRLAATQIISQQALLVTYAITVDGDAPAAVTVTGEEVSVKLQSENTELIGSAISAKVEESFGAGVFDLSLQAVNVPDVAVAPSVFTSTSTTHFTETVTMETTNATVGNISLSFQSTTSALPATDSSSTSALPATASSTTTGSSSNTFLHELSAGAQHMFPSRQILCTVFCLASLLFTDQR